MIQVVERGVSTFGRIGELLLRQPSHITHAKEDVLVSNAGICQFSDFLTMPIEIWERTRQVNLDGSFYIVQGM